MATAINPAIRRTPLETALSLFTEVRPGEGLTAILLTLDVFLILSSYYIVKPVREALILAGGGAEVKSYAAAGQAVLLLGAVPLYAALAARFPRRRLINSVSLFFIACLVLFYVLSLWHVPLGVVFFLWVGIFNLMVVAQFWSFANDVYTVDEGKRLFAIVAFGASAGAVFGSFITGRLIAGVGVYQMLLIAAGGLGTSLLLTNIIDSRERRAGRRPSFAEGTPAADENATADRGYLKRSSADSGPIDAASADSAPIDAASPGSVADQPIGSGGAFQLVFRSRYLLLIALLLLFLNWVNTTGEYILGKTVAQAASIAVANGSAGGLSQGQIIGKFYSDYFAVVNLAGLVVQMFLVSRIIRFIGVGRALLILPVIAFTSYAVLAFIPILSAVRWAKTAENSLDYSLHNTVRQALFLPTSRQAKYKAKQAIDTFFVRTGDVLSAGLVFVGTTWLALSTRGFALANLGLVVVWIGLAILIGREYRNILQRQQDPRGKAGA